MKALPSQPNLFLQVPKPRKIAPRNIKDQSPKDAFLYVPERVFHRIHNDFTLKMASLAPLSRKKEYIVNMLTNSTG